MSKLMSVCNYIIGRCNELNIYIDLLKLQKLIYYCQSWSLAYGRGAIFPEHFEAWIHGPVIRSVYDKFKEKRMYEKITIHDIDNKHSEYSLTEDDEQLIGAVILYYGKLTGDQLEALTHMEEPWKKARKGLMPYEKSKNHISEEIMEHYYKSLL